MSPMTNHTHQCISWCALTGKATIKGPHGTVHLPIEKHQASILAWVFGLTFTVT